MTVRDLIAFLQTVDPDMDVAYQCYSDYQRLQPGDVTVQNAIDHGAGAYIERATNYTAQRYPDDKRKPFLLFPGN